MIDQKRVKDEFFMIYMWLHCKTKIKVKNIGKSVPNFIVNMINMWKQGRVLVDLLSQCLDTLI